MFRAKFSTRASGSGFVVFGVYQGPKTLNPFRVPS